MISTSALLLVGLRQMERSPIVELYQLSLWIVILRPRAKRDYDGKLTDFPLEPSIIVRSGGGLHCYWLFREPIELQNESERIKSTLRRLARAVDGDLQAAEPARILRLPGTLNHKYTPFLAPSPSIPLILNCGITSATLTTFCPPRLPARSRYAGNALRLKTKFQKESVTAR